MSDDGIGIFFILVEEVVSSGEGYLVDVFVYLLFCHADASVADGQSASFLVERYVYCEVSCLFFQFALVGESLQLLCGVDSIAHYLADEDVVVRIEKLFYYGEDVLCGNPDISFLHVLKYYVSSIFIYVITAVFATNNVP